MMGLELKNHLQNAHCMILLSFVIAHCGSSDVYWSAEGFLCNIYYYTHYWCNVVNLILYAVADDQYFQLCFIDNLISVELQTTSDQNTVCMFFLYYSHGMAALIPDSIDRIF